VQCTTSSCYYYNIINCVKVKCSQLLDVCFQCAVEHVALVVDCPMFYAFLACIKGAPYLLCVSACCSAFFIHFIQQCL